MSEARTNPQSMRDLEERVHSIFLVKIIAGIIFDFYSSGRLGKVMILYQVTERRSKGRRGRGGVIGNVFPLPP